MYGLPNLFNIPNMSGMPNMSSMPNIQQLTDMIKPPSETYYSILNVLHTASEDEIKRAYRKLSLEYHPDRNHNDREKSEFYKKITEAYTILSNDAKRQQYDLSLKLSQGISTDDQTVFMNMFLKPFDPKNILDEIKNSSFGKNMFMNDPIAAMAFSNMPINKNDYDNFSQLRTSSKPSTINQTVTITLLEAYNGCKIPLSVTRWKIENSIKHEQTETVYINIPKGIDNNEIIVLQDKGNMIDETNRGNIDVKICVTNNTSFKRSGIDLILKKSITLKESFCGFSFDLKYIDGREFKINNEAGNVIPPEFRKTIPNLGMKRDDDTGNLIIIFDVIYPKQLSNKQIENLKEIL